MSTKYNIKFCPNCGTKTFPNAKFCVECGYELATLYNDNTIQTQQPSQNIKNNQENIPQENIEETIVPSKKETSDSIINDKIPETEENTFNETKQETVKQNSFDIVRPTNNNKKAETNKKNKSAPKKDFNILKNKNNAGATPTQQEGMTCPSCGNNMQKSQKKGILSSSIYHHCPNCSITFKANNEYLVLEEEPDFTRFKSKLHLKKYTYNQWKEILSGNYTPDEVNKITSWKYEEQTSIACPACSHQLNKYKTGGFVTHFLVCKYCNLILEEHKDQKYTLHNSTETYSPLWQYEKNALSIQELQGLFANESSENKKQRQHVIQSHEQQFKEEEKLRQQINDDIALFVESLENGKPMLPAPMDTTIVLKNKEHPVYKIDNVTLMEPRAVRTSSGGYGGTSVKITKNVTLHSGRTASKSESHDEIKVIDVGDLLITNQRIIFLGSNRTTNIDIKKIISIASENNRIQIQRSNKQKVEYFANINATRQVNINGRSYSIDVDSEMIKKLIIGLL